MQIFFNFTAVSIVSYDYAVVELETLKSKRKLRPCFLSHYGAIGAHSNHSPEINLTGIRSALMA